MVRKRSRMRVDADVAFLQFIAEAQRELLGAAAAGDHAHAEFHEAHVGLGVRHHLVRVQAELGAAAEAELVRCGHHGDAAVAHAHHGVLERADGHVQVLVFLLHGHHEDHAHVGAGAEERAVVVDHEAFVALARRGRWLC
jgi:hypothetical protein